MIMNEQQEKLVLDNMGFANYLAMKMSKKIPRYITLDELKSAAYEGLIAATKNYDHSTKFTTYSSYFIRGSMLDYIRYVSESRKKHKLEFVSLDSRIGSDDKTLGETICGKTNSHQFTEDFFDGLKNIVNKREMWILRTYYIEEKCLNEIAKILKIGRTGASFALVKARNKILRFIRENRNNRHTFAYDHA